MAGVSVDAGGNGGRRALDSELNMIPMIDLLMVTISFLLITAVWTQMARVEARADVPGQSEPCAGDCPQTRELHLEMRDREKFVLTWKEGTRELRPSTIVARVEHVEHFGSVKVTRFAGLADALRIEYRQMGLHANPTDRALDRVVLHTDDESPYTAIVGAMDAVHDVTRPTQVGSTVGVSPSFEVTFAAK